MAVRSPLRSAIDLGAAVLGATTLAEYLTTATRALGALFDSDDIFWMRADFGTSQVIAQRQDPGPGPIDTICPAHLIKCHPSVRSYLADPSDPAPRRVSDVATSAQWSRNPSWQEMFRPTGQKYQLSLVVQLNGRTVGAGWILTRSSADFDDLDVRTAELLLPMLTTTHAMHSARAGALAGPDFRTSPRPDDSAESAAQVQLTIRQRQVLSLLDDGLSAENIGRSLNISTLTVRKHLENIYARLDCHDRLVATRRARALHLLR